MRIFLLLLAALTTWGCSPAPSLPADPAEATLRIHIARGDGEAPSVFSSQIPGYGQEAVGAGVLIDRSGLFLSAAHLFSPSDTAIWATMSDGHIFHALLVSKNEESDLALLQLEATAEMLQNLSVLPIAEGGWPEVGDPLLTFQGSDEHGQPQFTEGQVLALSQSIVAGKSLLELPLTGLIQIDLPVHAGFSGGPVLNGQAELVGILTAGTADGLGGGYATPVQSATLEKLFEI